MTSNYFDRRFMPNGKKSVIKMDNNFNITKYVTERATVISNNAINNIDLLTKPVSLIDDTYSVDENDYFVRVNNIEPISIVLPDATTVEGKEFVIFANDIVDVITVNATVGNINGSPTFVLNAQYDYVKVISDGSNYFVLDNRITP